MVALTVQQENLRSAMGQQLAPDMVNHPPHYTNGGVECIDAIASAVEGDTPQNAYLRGTALKYLWRAGRKQDAKQDLDKAIFYINRLKETL